MATFIYYFTEIINIWLILMDKMQTNVWKHLAYVHLVN